MEPSRHRTEASNPEAAGELEAALGAKPYQIYELETDLGSKLTIIDFTEAMCTVVGDDRVRDFYTLYAIEEERGSNVSFYRGVRDFFLSGDSTVAEITYGTGNESKTFRSALMGKSAEGYMDLSALPPGKVRLQNLSAGQKTHLQVTVQTEKMICQEGTFRLLRLDTGYGIESIVAERIGYTPIPMDRG